MGQKYFDQEKGEEEEEFDKEEKDVAWNDGTMTEMVSGALGNLYSCGAETYGNVVVDTNLKELDTSQHENDLSPEEEFLGAGPEDIHRVASSNIEMRY